MKTLYFDIDGVLLCYDDNQRPILANGALENRLKRFNFNKLVCVSGWSDIVNSGMKSERQQKQAIYKLLNEIFLDEDWFLNHLELVYDTDTRCQHIDLTSDWYYMDDWADKFFIEYFDKSLYEQALGRRILLVNPHGDGSDILTWLDAID
ncbi:MAG: hypothetical protein ACPGR2_14690 [Psychrobium sp.]